MAYTPTEWVTGDVITAVKLNNMEQGIEDAFVAPAVTIADEGDVLTVNSSGVWVAAAPASQLPAVTSSDAGDVLTVNSSGEWAAAAPASQLPEVTAADQGKVLTVDSSGEWDAANLPADKDILELEGTFVVDATLAPQSFTITSGDITKLDEYKTAYIKVTVSISGTTTVFYGYVPYTRRIVLEPLTMAEKDDRAFEMTFLNAVSSGSLSLGFIMLTYDVLDGTWSYIFRLYSVTTN